MTCYRNLLAVAAVAVFYTNVPMYVNPFIPGAVPLWWILAFGLLLAPLLLTQKTPWNALRSPVALWCFGYAWVTIMWFFQSSQLELPWQGMRWRFLSIVSVMCFLILFWDAGAIRSARKAVLAATLFGVAVNIYEVFVPLSFSPIYGRSAGLYQNPNEAGEILVLGMIVSVTLLPAYYRGPFTLLTGIGVVSTFSRSGIVAWLIAVMSFILAGRVDVKKPLVWSFVGLVGIVLLSPGGQLFTTLGGIGILDKSRDVQERLLWFTDPSGVSDDSSWSRTLAAKRAWAEITDHPWIGSGTGSSLQESAVATHNQYLSYMQEHGIFVGATILPLLVLALIWGACGESRHLALIFACTVMWQGLFSHGFLDLADKILLVALIAAMAGTSRSSEVGMTMAMKPGVAN